MSVDLAETMSFCDVSARTTFTISSKGAYLLLSVFLREVPRRKLTTFLDAYLNYSHAGVCNSIEVGICHWIKRGWWNSLRYYLASLDCRFADEIDMDGAIRRQLLQHYENDETEPKALLAENGTISLPLPDKNSMSKLVDVMRSRRTCRRFDAKSPITSATLSTLLHVGSSQVRRSRNARQAGHDKLRLLMSYGSAIDIYLTLYDVVDLSPGVYSYHVTSHTLSCISEEPCRRKMSRILWGQPAPLTASLTLVFVADFARYQWLYRHEHAYRNLFVEAGRIAQSLLLAAARLGLGCLVTPAFQDTRLGSVLKLAEYRQYPMYSLTVGNPPRAKF